MTHALHTGRYSGAATIPRTNAAPVPAAALVLHHPTRKVQIDPMFRQLDAVPALQWVEAVRLVPVVVVDFYRRTEARACARRGAALQAEGC